MGKEARSKGTFEERRSMAINEGRIKGGIMDKMQAQPQMQINPAETVPVVCSNCGGELWESVFHVGKFSKLAPSNRSGQDLNVKIETLVCYECGTELTNDKDPEVKEVKVQ